MKKFLMKSLVAILAVANLIGVSPVFAAEEAQGSDDKISIVATTTQVTDLMKVIGGDHVEVKGLMGVGVDPHGYEPTPSDIEALEGAELVAWNGVNLEQMFADTFDAMERSGANIYAVEDAVKEEDLLMAEQEGQTEPDPHVWFNIQIWEQAAQLAAEELSALDPDNAEDYQANYEAYKTELEELKAYNEEKISTLPEEDRILVTAHDAFSYFADSYGFQVESIQGINTQSEAGTGDIAEIADLIVEKEVPAIFIETSVSDRNIQALIEAVEDRGGSLEIGGELYSDSLGSAEDEADTYITMYKKNVDTIVGALAK